MAMSTGYPEEDRHQPHFLYLGVGDSGVGRDVYIYGLSCGLASFSSLTKLLPLTASYPRQVLRVQFMASMLMCWLSRRRSITGVRRELGLNDRGLVEDGG